MKKLEMIELEPYQAPALADIVPVSVVYGDGTSVEPETPGGEDPVPGGDDPSEWE